MAGLFTDKVVIPLQNKTKLMSLIDDFKNAEKINLLRCKIEEAS